MKRDWRPKVEVDAGHLVDERGFLPWDAVGRPSAHRSIFGKVTERIEQADGVRFVLDVWTEDLAGVKLTDGDAAVDLQTVV